MIENVIFAALFAGAAISCAIWYCRRQGWF
jgi:hypothetical protein